MKLTVQQRYVDPEFKQGAYLELRLRAKRLGELRAGDVVEIVATPEGNLIIRKENGYAGSKV